MPAMHQLEKEVGLPSPPSSSSRPVASCVRILPILPPLLAVCLLEVAEKGNPNFFCDWSTTAIGGPQWGADEGEWACGARGRVV